MDLANAITAARATSSDDHAWWIAVSDPDEALQALPLSSTLDAFAEEPPKRIERAIDDDKRPAWHWMMLARAIGGTKPAKATIGSKPVFIEGSLKVKGPLKLKSSLVVTGDLVIDGPLIDVVEAWHQLVVGGNLEAHAIASSQTILVGGDCKVRDLVWGFEMHCPLAVRGTIKTPLLVLSDYRPARFGAEEIATKLENADLDAMSRHFDPKLLRDCDLKPQAVIARLLANKPFGPEPAKATAKATAKAPAKTSEKAPPKTPAKASAKTPAKTPKKLTKSR